MTYFQLFVDLPLVLLVFLSILEEFITIKLGTSTTTDRAKRYAG